MSDGCPIRFLLPRRNFPCRLKVPIIGQSLPYNVVTRLREANNQEIKKEVTSIFLLSTPIDKMDAVSIVVAEREGEEAYKAITDVDNYSNYTFSMHGGDVKYVTLVFINHKMDSIIDRFGNDVVVSYHDETHSKVTVPVALSDAFYSWVFGFGKAIRIAAPQEAIDGMKKLLTDVASRYIPIDV